MSNVAGPGRRLKAGALDAAAVLALLCAGMVVVSWLDRRLSQFWVVSIFAAWSVLLPPGYLFTEVLRGRTPGKKLTGLKVGDAAGGPASRRALWARWLLKSSPVLVGTAGMLAQIAADRFPAYGLLQVVTKAIQEVSGRLRSDAALGVMFTPIVYAAGVPLAAALAAGWLMVLGPSRRALHDRLTGTAVYVVPTPETEGHAFEPLIGEGKSAGV